MKQIISLLSLFVICFSASAQQFVIGGTKDDRTQAMQPGMTEYYYPKVPVVTPGDIKTNSAPSDAIVLFDGKDLSAWIGEDGTEAQWNVNGDGTMTVNTEKPGIKTKESFGDCQLHIEWYVPVGLPGSGQGKGNSGVFLQGRYEVQVLDSYNNETYSNGQAGSIYKQSAPLVNPIRPEGEWNVYDIIYKAPTFKADGTYRTKPQITVLFNGVLVQDNTIIVGTTEYIGLPQVAPHGDAPVSLQNHGNPISFRNIWLRKL